MALKLTVEMTKEIVGELQMGMLCFYNVRTSELVCYPDSDKFSDDMDAWEEDMEKVERNEADYVQFDAMDSHESYRLMKRFVDEMPKGMVRERFAEVLEQRKPFMQFK